MNNVSQDGEWSPSPTPEPSSTLCDRYEKELCNILGSLGDIKEEHKYFRVNDNTTFREFGLSPPELKKVSESLGVSILRSTPLAEVAEFLFKKHPFKNSRKILDM